MLDIKTTIGIVAVGLGVVSYSFYVWDTYRGKTKPDGFSWLIWSVLAGITFFAQIQNGAGPGAWVTALTCLACLLISLMAFSRGKSRGKMIEWISLVGAGLALVLWISTSDPLLAVELIIGIGAAGFIPTFRKAYYRPKEETLITFLMNGCKFGLALFALNSYSPTVWLYPAALVFMNFSLAILIAWRRRG